MESNWRIFHWEIETKHKRENQKHKLILYVCAEETQLANWTFKNDLLDARTIWLLSAGLPRWDLSPFETHVSHSTRWHWAIVNKSLRYATPTTEDPHICGDSNWYSSAEFECFDRYFWTIKLLFKIQIAKCWNRSSGWFMEYHITIWMNWMTKWSVAHIFRW